MAVISTKMLQLFFVLRQISTTNAPQVNNKLIMLTTSDNTSKSLIVSPPPTGEMSRTTSNHLLR